SSPTLTSPTLIRRPPTRGSMPRRSTAVGRFFASIAFATARRGFASRWLWAMSTAMRTSTCARTAAHLASPTRRRAHPITLALVSPTPSQRVAAFANSTQPAAVSKSAAFSLKGSFHTALKVGVEVDHDAMAVFPHEHDLALGAERAGVFFQGRHEGI